LSIAEIETMYEGQGYGTFKKDLAEQVVAALEPIQQKYHEIRASGEIKAILRQGAEKAMEMANPKLREAKQKMGFLLP
jgi:tryptophanyl-tRNA synthetase